MITESDVVAFTVVTTVAAVVTQVGFWKCSIRLWDHDWEEAGALHVAAWNLHRKAKVKFGALAILFGIVAWPSSFLSFVMWIALYASSIPGYSH